MTTSGATIAIFPSRHSAYVVRAKPVRRRTAALVIRAILVSPELGGMAGFLSDTMGLAG